MSVVLTEAVCLFLFKEINNFIFLVKKHKIQVAGDGADVDGEVDTVADGAVDGIAAMAVGVIQ